MLYHILIKTQSPEEMQFTEILNFKAYCKELYFPQLKPGRISIITELILFQFWNQDDKIYFIEKK